MRRQKDFPRAVIRRGGRRILSSAAARAVSEREQLMQQHRNRGKGQKKNGGALRIPAAAQLFGEDAVAVLRARYRLSVRAIRA